MAEIAIQDSEIERELSSTQEYSLTTTEEIITSEPEEEEEIWLRYESTLTVKRTKDDWFPLYCEEANPLHPYFGHAAYKNDLQWVFIEFVFSVEELDDIGNWLLFDTLYDCV